MLKNKEKKLLFSIDGYSFVIENTYDGDEMGMSGHMEPGYYSEKVIVYYKKEHQIGQFDNIEEGKKFVKFIKEL